MNVAPLLEPWLQTIATVFGQNTVYAVGGAVRNIYLGLPISDIDLCGAVKPEAVIALCEGTPITAKLRAAHFGTVELHIQGHMAEYTTFRKDSYRTGHQPIAVEFADTIEVDAIRRDFSVNALYAPLQNPNQIIDPVGGLRHLQERILHTVTQDPDQVLKDDGLRILRAVRFQAELGFALTDAVLHSAEKFGALLDQIVAERKRDELIKILMADQKYPSITHAVPPVSHAMRTIVHIGAWQRLFGELIPIEFSVLDHAQQLSCCKRIILLFHLEKPTAVAQWMYNLHLNKREANAVQNSITILQGLQSQATKASDSLQYGIADVEHVLNVLCVLAEWDAKYQPMYQRIHVLVEQIHAKRIPASIADLAINGEAVAAICTKYGYPARYIGKVLHHLWCAAVDLEIPNQQEALLNCANRFCIDSGAGQ